MFLGTLEDYSRRKIGELLISSSLEIARELKRGNPVKMPVTINDSNVVENYDAVPTLSSAIMTSIYSRKIAMRLGFEVLLELNFDQYELNGKKFSDNIEKENRTFVLVAKRIL